jgi:hypothetical protein
VHGYQGTVLKRLAITKEAELKTGASGYAENACTVHTPHSRRQSRSRVRSSGSRLHEACGVGPACMPQKALVPNKGGRGIEPLRQFWLPNPAAARFQGTSCYTNLLPAARHFQSAPASLIPYIKTAMAESATESRRTPDRQNHYYCPCSTPLFHSLSPSHGPSHADRRWEVC